HARFVNGHRRRQDHQGRALAFPKCVYHGCHKSQDATRALKLVQARPVVVQTVEKLRMNRIGGLHSPLVLSFAASRRKLLGLTPVELGKGAYHRVARGKELWIGNRLKEASPDNL